MIGYVVFALVGVMFLVADLIQRIVIGPLAWMRPRARERILSRWIQVLRRTFFVLVQGVGGARFEVRDRVPAAGGTLVVMNHQSLLDIPVGVWLVADGYPRFVLRARYARGVPLISHIARLYRNPVVSPGRRNRAEIEGLREAARTSEQPILIFPEGHRTRDGNIGRWRKGGLNVLLAERNWEVYVAVLDGAWHAISIGEFMRNLGRLECRAEVLGPFAFDRERDDADAFIDRLRTLMCDKLAEMRAASRA